MIPRQFYRGGPEDRRLLCMPLLQVGNHYKFLLMWIEAQDIGIDVVAHEKIAMMHF